MRELLRKLPKFWRWLGVLLLTGFANFWALRGLEVEEDVVASIERSHPRESQIFHHMQQLGLFQDRVFIKILDPKVRAEVLQALPEFGYKLVTLNAASEIAPQDWYRILLFMPEAFVATMLAPERVAAVLSQVKETSQLPGGMGLMKMLEQDPLLMSPDLSQFIREGKSESSAEAVLVAERVGPLDYSRVAQFYQFLQARDQQLMFLCGDFFALENRDSVQRDIAICTALSLILGLICFRLFCRQWQILAFLLVGTCFSSALGLITVRSVDGMIYGLVLAFGSTFVSFNNETLVHLAGLRSPRSWRSMIGMASAIGTTVLGFLVLLFSTSQLARQMALLALGSLFGFMLFLKVFAGDVQALQFRPVALRRIHLGRWLSFGLAGILLGSILYLPKPAYHTDLTSFRYSSPYLEQQVQRFSQAFSSFDLQSLQAIAVTREAELLDDFKSWQAQGLLHKTMFHPLRFYRPPAEQRSAELQSRLRLSLETLSQGLAAAGLRVTLPKFEAAWQVLEPLGYLKLWNQLSPVPWTQRIGSTDYMLVFGSKVPFLAEALPLHPKLFYEYLLKELSRNLGHMFLGGLLLMLLYLLPWQRDMHKIALIFLPLLAACLVLQLLFLLTGRTINIVHMMGASLVIAVALDYSSILISNEHAPEDQGKVILTGGLTLTSFGSLLLASHPVLRELGLIVVIGSGVSWIFALVFGRAGMVAE